MNVRKRSGKIVPFDREFITRAISLASAATGEAAPELVETITEDVVKRLSATGKDIVDIEKIQDVVEDSLFENRCYQTAKAYILYRTEKEKERVTGEWKEGLLSREFLSPYKHSPNPMEQLGSFVYTRTYSRFMPRLGRREFWWETVRRAVEYNCSSRQPPGRRRKSCLTMFTICASSFPDVPSGWATLRWRRHIRWRTITAPLR